MPVEIKELIVRTNIVGAQPGGNSTNAVLSEEDKREIVNSCMKKVEKLMKKQKQR